MADKPLTPEEIVQELSRFIISQDGAKRCVANALRNRWRRSQLSSPMKEEILPKNILMIGPTGVGKTEIARRMARLMGAPFVKVEATKFTEVGYVGRDVEQIIRDLVEVSLSNIRQRMYEEIKEVVQEQVNQRLLKALVGDSASDETRAKFAKKLQDGLLEKNRVEIEVQAAAKPPVFELPQGVQMGMMNLGDLIKGFSERSKTRRLLVEDARKLLTEEESEKALDQEKIVREALDDVEQNGIVFIDEIDKICEENRHGKVSREGVQRDLLPLLEGSTVPTKYGIVKTDHILFIASGAFYVAKPSDLLPELQGRLPIRVELSPLEEHDFVRILTEPETSLLLQYQALLAVESVDLHFEPEAIQAIARVAAEVNAHVENIGARRLHTVLEKLLEDISFYAHKSQGERIVIDSKKVMTILAPLAKDPELSRFVL